METIKIYVGNMFKTLPRTEGLKKLKQDILINLESNAKMAIEVEFESLKSKVTFGTIIGVALCILSPIAIFLGGMICIRNYNTYFNCCSGSISFY